MATVLITGASRGLGRATVARAIAAGHAVRALARTADTIQEDGGSLKTIVGSALDAELLREALDGVDAVITAIGTPPTLQPVTLFSQGAKTMIAAMRGAGVSRLIAVTGIGAGDSRGKGGPLYAKFFQPLFLGTVYADKSREEALIRDSGLAWTIVRPGFLTRLPAEGNCRVITDPAKWKGGFVSRMDVAEFLVRQIGDDTYLHQTPLVLG